MRVEITLETDDREYTFARDERTQHTRRDDLTILRLMLDAATAEARGVLDDGIRDETPTTAPPFEPRVTNRER